IENSAMRPMSRQAIWILLSAAITACLTSKLSAQYRFDSWTTENGLPQNSICGIRQTRDGYLWMTTSSSLVRFDGVRFREFNRWNAPGLTAEGFSFYALIEDRQGCLWAGTWTAGAVRYCHGVFTTFTTREDSRATAWSASMKTKKGQCGSLPIRAWRNG